MCIRRQIAGGTHFFKEREQNVRVTVSRVNDRRLRSAQPRPNLPAGADYVERIVENPGIRRDAHESQHGDPGKADAARAVHQGFPPFPRRIVAWGLRVEGVQQQVDVWNDHGEFGTNAEIVLQLSASSYTIVAFTNLAGGRGAFELSVNYRDHDLTDLDDEVEDGGRRTGDSYTEGHIRQRL